ncbi:MAG: Tyrosine--tRNA ligase [Parcubacteria group bacterium]|nr:Tyrosine--tRNA ligase [Parcubacteria group bacterium]
MNLIEDLKARGLVEHHSAELEKIFATKRTVYLGVDPSADSMQAGNLAVILLMKRLADAGHRIILLVGGGTGMIGDPRESGERTLPDERAIKRNAKALRDQMQRIVGSRVTLVNNADWLLKIKLVDFLRDIGKHFTVNELIKRDIIRKRLETPDESISYTEFAYSLLQGYDYLTLNQKYGCDLQVGGSDQWTNLLSGVELIRRKLGKEAFAVTIPLVTDATGKKFGKSEGNAVWLAASRTSPFAFYQFWLNQPDTEVGKLMKFYTFLSPIEINALMELHARNPERRTAQRKLALEVTTLVHGETEAMRAEKFTDILFGNASLDQLAAAEREALFSSVPSASVPDGTSIVDTLTSTEFVASKSEARRLIDAKGIRLNGETVTSDRPLTASDFEKGLAVLQKGKSEKLLVRFK